MSSKKRNPFVQLKDKTNNELSIINNDNLTTDLVKLSFLSISSHSIPSTYDRRLVTIARYDRGHYLVYDNHQILAYTIIMQ